MAITVNTNIASLTAQRNLVGSQNTLNKALARLSSGLRINSAKDDAAGLAISDRMTAQVRGLNQAARNANDGISLAQTAEGALQESTSILQRIRELAVQSANDTNTAEDRASLDAEVTQLVAELDRIAQTTAFNGKNVLDGTLTGAIFQVGADAGTAYTISFDIDSARAADLGTVTAGVTAVAAAAAITAVAAVTGVAATLTTNTDLVLTADAAGTAGNAITFEIATGTAVGVTVTGTAILVTLGDGTAVAANYTTAEVAALIQADTAAAALVDATAGATTAVAVGGPTALAGGVTAVVGVTAVAAITAVAEVIGTTTVDQLSVATVADSQITIESIDVAIADIDTIRAGLGAVQNRFESTISNLMNVSENIAAARSRILDADFAAETSEMTKAQILQQAGMAMLSQANSIPQGALSLLQ